MSRLTTLLFFLPAFAFAQHSWHMPLTGHLHLPRVAADTSVHDSSSHYSSIWGYTDPRGREYAVLGCWSGTSIIDITDSAVEVGWIPGLPSIWREMKTRGHYLYVCTEKRGTGQGIQIIDLADPHNPVLVATFDSTLTGAHTVSLDRNFLYCNGTNDKLRILDITNPIHPLDVGIDTTMQLPYVHDALVRNDTMYASHVYDNTGVGIYDMHDKQHPQQLGLFTYPGAGTHSAALTGDGRYLITADEIGDTRHDCKVWDIGDVRNARMLTEFSFSDSDVAHNPFIKGHRVYVAHYTAGICVWDIANVSIPVLVGYYDTYPDEQPPLTYNGAWGTYPYFASGKIVTSDRSHGLFVNTLQESPVSRVNVRVRDSTTHRPVPLALVTLFTPALEDSALLGRGVTNIGGLAGVGVADSGDAFLFVARDSQSLPQIVPVHLIADSTVLVNVTLFDDASAVAQSGAPENFHVLPPSPNPASAGATMHYVSANDGTARIELLAITGAVRARTSARITAGQHELPIMTSALGAGTYFCVITVDGKSTVTPLTIVR